MLARKAMTLQSIGRIALRTGGLSMLTVILAILALHDIYHGEADVRLEWMMVRVSFAVIIVFHVLALTVAWKASRLSVRADPR